MSHDTMQREKIDAAKGFLILCVILGHIQLFMAKAPEIFIFVNNFHVAVFLLLVFLRPAEDFSIKNMLKWARRYLWPYAGFALIFSLIFYVASQPDYNLHGFILSFLQNLLIASGDSLDKIMGFQSLWFLPALFTMLVIRSLLPHSCLFMGVAFLAHIVIGLVPEPQIWFIPLALPYALFALGLGLFAEKVAPHVKPAWHLWLFGLFLICQIISLYGIDSRIGMSRMRIYDLTAPGYMILHDILIISALFWLVLTPWLHGVTALKWLGQNSLQIYLYHHFIYHVSAQILMRGAGIASDSLIWGAALFIWTVTASCLVAFCVNHLPQLKKRLFPR